MGRPRRLRVLGDPYGPGQSPDEDVLEPCFNGRYLEAAKAHGPVPLSFLGVKRRPDSQNEMVFGPSEEGGLFRRT